MCNRMFLSLPCCKVGVGEGGGSRGGMRNRMFLSLPCCQPRLPVRKANCSSPLRVLSLQPRLPVRKAKDPPFERLLICGDSTVFYSWKILVQGTRRPCKVGGGRESSVGGATTFSRNREETP